MHSALKQVKYLVLFILFCLFINVIFFIVFEGLKDDTSRVVILDKSLEELGPEIYINIEKAYLTWASVDKNIPKLIFKRGCCFELKDDGIDTITYQNLPTKNGLGNKKDSAITVNYLIDGKIMSGDIVINKEISFFGINNNDCEYNKYNINTVVIHELGHLYGLPHIPDKKAAMYESISPDDCDVKIPNKKDIDLLRRIYSKK